MPADLNYADAQVDRRTWEADWDLQGTVHYICAGGFQRVALQFPDELLKDAVLVTRDLQRLCSEQSSGCQVHTTAGLGKSKQKCFTASKLQRHRLLLHVDAPIRTAR